MVDIEDNETKFMEEIDYIKKIISRDDVFNDDSFMCYYCEKYDEEEKVQIHIQMEIPEEMVRLEVDGTVYNFHAMRSSSTSFVHATTTRSIHKDCIDKLRALMRLHNA